MGLALSTGVTGLKAHQQMLDIAGNNLANVSTTAFKRSRISFSQLLTEVIKNASAPTTTLGGTNPQQVGSGVGTSGITPNMSQGNIVSTGNPLDLAIEGEGYFALSKGAENRYTRAGTFGVDADSYLVDPTTGYFVQRHGSVGESEGFQEIGDTRIVVPYDASLPPSATSEIKVRGNLSSDAQLAETQKQKLRSNIIFTTSGSIAATAIAEVDQLEQFSGGSGTGGQLGASESGVITFSGYKPDGTALSATGSSWVDLTMDVDTDTTLADVLTFLNTNDGIPVRNEMKTLTVTATAGHIHLSDGTDTTGEIAFGADATTVQAELISSLASVGAGDVVCAGTLAAGMTITFQDDLANQEITDWTIDTTGLTGTGTIEETTKGRDAVRGVLGGDATATLENGRIVIEDNVAGYSKSDLAMAWSGDGTLVTPAYFEYATVGGEEVQNVNITIFDNNGGAHVFSGAFVRTDTDNLWDMILTSVSGDINEITFGDRRIEGIEFSGVDSSYAGLNAGIGDTAQFIVTFDQTPPSPQTVTVNFGTVGKFDGLTQFATGATGTSTAVIREQDGYRPGALSGVTINNEGIVIGLFDNGIKKKIATIKIALFQNPAGLESVDSGYFIESANSGDAVATQGLSSGAGSIHGGALEKSNVNEADEFIAMIQAQNGYQANARTIRIANEMLRELTNLIR